MIEPRTQTGQSSGGIAVAVAIPVVDGMSGHGHDHVYDHDLPRLSRDLGGAYLLPGSRQDEG